MSGIGWGWAGVIWLYNLVTYFPLDLIKFAVRYILSGKAWNTLIERKVAFTKKKDYGKETREAQWALAQRTRHGLHQRLDQSLNVLSDMAGYQELTEIAEQAKRRAEMARLRELHTWKGHVELVVRSKGLDIGARPNGYTM